MKTNLQKILAFVSIAMLNTGLAQAADFDTTAPADVSNVVVEKVTEDSIELSWDKASDDTAIGNYKIYFGKSSVQVDGGYYDEEVLTGDADTQYTLENLDSGATYYIAVTALDTNENESYNYSIEVEATTEQKEVLHYAPEDEQVEEDEPVAAVNAGKVNAELTVDAESGSAPLKVKFDASESTQKDGAIASYAWDYNSDGIVDSTLPAPSYTFTESGVYEVSLVVTATDGQTDTAETVITVWDTEVVDYVEPVIEEVVEEIVPEEISEEVAPVETPAEPEENLPETGPALLIPVLVAGAGALITRRRK